VGSEPPVLDRPAPGFVIDALLCALHVLGGLNPPFFQKLLVSRTPKKLATGADPLIFATVHTHHV
jgi:hypothetical protein